MIWEYGEGECGIKGRGSVRKGDWQKEGNWWAIGSMRQKGPTLLITLPFPFLSFFNNCFSIILSFGEFNKRILKKTKRRRRKKGRKVCPWSVMVLGQLVSPYTQPLDQKVYLIEIFIAFALFFIIKAIFVFN